MLILINFILEVIKVSDEVIIKILIFFGVRRCVMIMIFSKLMFFDINFDIEDSNVVFLIFILDNYYFEWGIVF